MVYLGKSKFSFFGRMRCRYMGMVTLRSQQQYPLVTAHVSFWIGSCNLLTVYPFLDRGDLFRSTLTTNYR